jgi:hypothetical protein
MAGTMSAPPPRIGKTTGVPQPKPGRKSAAKRKPMKLKAAKPMPVLGLINRV